MVSRETLLGFGGRGDDVLDEADAGEVGVTLGDALREQAAAEAWPALLEVAKGAEWPKDQRERVRTALDEFEARHGTTACAAAFGIDKGAPDHPRCQGPAPPPVRR